MSNKEQAREEIKNLVEKYNKLLESGRAKSYNEEIDQEVYKIYGINKEEQKIIEESLR